MINQNISKPLLIATDLIDQEILFATTNETIENDLDSLMKIKDFNFVKNMTLVIDESETSNIIFIILPDQYESTTNIYVTDEFDYECKDSYLVPANKVKYISCINEVKENFKYYNHITTLTSNKKNLRFIYGRGFESTNFMIFNYMGLPTIAEKDNQDYGIIRNRYEPKFTFFGAVNPHIFKSFYYVIAKGVFQLLKSYFRIDFESIMTPKQVNIRINSNILPWFEFYNFFFNQFELKINLYIKQIYGGSDIYECEVDEDQKDLTFLTTPISNTKCKNKRSIFNRLFTFEGTKILSGYITPDSYFDIYAEIEMANNNNIFLLNNEFINLTYTNNAKYLRKNVEYKLNFYANHMLKLKPGYDDEIIITNGINTSTINQNAPITEIIGNDYTIKSTNGAMVYFLEKLNEQLINQTEIDIE